MNFTPWSLIPLWVRALVILAVVSAVVGAITWGVHSYNESLREEGRAEIRQQWQAEREHQQADALKRAQANAKETFRRMEAQQENSDAQVRELARYQRVAADAVAARDELQHDFDNLTAVARRGFGDSATADERKAGAAAAGVLANVSRGADAMAELYARQADHSRRAGVLCERSYDALRPQP